MNASTAKSNYLLLLRQPAGGVPSPEELKKIMVRFSAWMEAMSANGMVQGTNGLDVTGKVLRGPRGASMTDGPYVETKEIVGGYVLISAANLDEAIEAARNCPGLDYGMTVEVRPVVQRSS